MTPHSKETVYILTICLLFSTRLRPMVPRKAPKPSCTEGSTGETLVSARAPAGLPASNARAVATLRKLSTKGQGRPVPPPATLSAE